MSIKADQLIESITTQLMELADEDVSLVQPFLCAHLVGFTKGFLRHMGEDTDKTVLLEAGEQQHITIWGKGIKAQDLKDLRERNAEMESAIAAKIPDGWKLVPIEPTRQQQHDAAFNLCNTYGAAFTEANGKFALDAYRELVRQAPEPEKKP